MDLTMKTNGIPEKNNPLKAILPEWESPASLLMIMVSFRLKKKNTS